MVSVALVAAAGCSVGLQNTNEFVYSSHKLITSEKLPWFVLGSEDNTYYRSGDVYFAYIWVGDQLKPASYPNSHCICIAWNSKTDEIAGGHVPFPPDAAGTLYPDGMVGKVVNSHIAADESSTLSIEFPGGQGVWVSKINLVLGRRVPFVSGERSWSPDLTQEQVEKNYSSNLFSKSDWRVGSYFDYASDEEFEDDQFMLIDHFRDWKADGSPAACMLQNGGIEVLWREGGLARRLQQAVSE